MKKFLAFALVACLAFAPVSAFAEEYDNGYENGYEYEVEYDYENGEESDYDYEPELDEEYEEEAEYEAVEENDENDEEEAYEEEAEEVEEELEVEPVYVEGLEEGIMAISADLGQSWEFRSWSAETGEGFHDENFAVVDSAITFTAPFEGNFYLTGSVITNGLAFEVALNGEIISYGDGSYDYDLHHELALEAGDVLTFVQVAVEAEEAEELDENDEENGNEEYDEEYEAEAEEAAQIEWNIVVREVVSLEIEEAEEVEETAEVEEEVTEEVVEEEAEVLPPANPLAGVETRYVNGVEFVAFRAAANAFGSFILSWDGATSTVLVAEVGYFTVESAGGFNENGTVYVPVSFAVEFFA